MEAAKKISSQEKTYVLDGEEGPIPITMHFTRNKDLITQYKNLRERLYKEDPRFVGFRIFAENDAENYEDPDDQMLILHDGKKCYGGACLRVSTPNRPVILDLEGDILPPPGESYFSLRKYIPEMELDKYCYSEFNRIVVDPQLRQGECTRRIFQAMLDRCLEYRVRYITGIGDKIRCRLYRQIYKNLGLTAVPNNLDIPMRPDYEGLKMYFIYWDTKELYKNNSAESLLLPPDNFKFTD